MSDLLVIRHGQASFGKGNYDRLSETGEAQAVIAAEWLHGNGWRFDAVISGTLERQRRTAEIIRNVYAEKGAELPEPEILPGFDEHATASVMRALLPVLIEEEPALAIDAEKLFESKRSFQMVFERVMLRWISGKDRIPDVESWEDFNARVRNALREIMVRPGRGQKVAVVASGGSISASVRYAMGISDETAMRLSWQIANTAFTRFKYTAERITLDGFNCYGHLECSGVEGILTYR